MKSLVFRISTLTLKAVTSAYEMNFTFMNLHLYWVISAKVTVHNFNVKCIVCNELRYESQGFISSRLVIISVDCGFWSVHPADLKSGSPPYFEIPQWKFLPYLSRVSSLLHFIELKQPSFLVKYDTLVKRSNTDSAMKVLFSVMGVLCARQYSVKFLYEEN